MAYPRKYAIQAPGEGWRERLKKTKADFTNRDLDEIRTDLENKVYAMALDGAGLSTIAAYFGVSPSEFKNAFYEVWSAGNAELKAIIAQNSVEYGLNSNIPVAKIWLGKSMGGLGESKSVDVEADDDSEVTFNVSIVRKQGPSEDE